MIDDELKNRKGFIAALDQSGGSSRKILTNYGINETEYKNDEEMFDLIHKMRSRIITNPEFTGDSIFGVILFKHTMNNKIDGIDTVEYLKQKNILSFLKIDEGLEDLCDGVRLLKDIPNLDDVLTSAKKHGIIGTKMRSVIYDYNEFGIKTLIREQFSIAIEISKYGLIPIIEPEIDINAKTKRQI